MEDAIVSSSSTSIDIGYPGVWIYPDVTTYGENFTFSITIYDVACYYGAFINPPALKSPDVLPSNVFEVSGTAMKDINTLKTSKIGWFRLLRWYAGVYYSPNGHGWDSNRLWVHTYYFEPGYHAQSSAHDTYDSFTIECGMLPSYYTNASHYTVMFLKVRQFGQKVGAYSKFRFARGNNLLYSVIGVNNVKYNYYDLYLEAYYATNTGSDISRIYADNVINNTIRIDNITGNPDGNDDVLIGSEVVPTLEGTAINIS